MKRTAYYGGIETDIPSEAEIAEAFAALEATEAPETAPETKLPENTMKYTPPAQFDRKTVILKCTYPSCTFEKRRQPFLYFPMDMMDLVQKTWKCPEHSPRFHEKK